MPAIPLACLRELKPATATVRELPLACHTTQSKDSLDKVRETETLQLESFVCVGRKRRRGRGGGGAYQVQPRDNQWIESTGRTAHSMEISGDEHGR